MERLNSHKLLRGSLESLRSTGLLQKAQDQRYVLTELEYYDWHVAFASLQLLELCQQLFDTASLLNNYPARSTGITSFKYLMYTLENWHLRCGSVEDRAVNLINRSFHLGCHKPGAADFVLKNTKVARTNVPTHFKKLQRTLQKHRKVRNEIVHAGSLVPHGMKDVAILYVYDDAMIAQHEVEQFRLGVKTHRAQRLAQVRKTNREHLLAANDHIIAGLVPLADALVPIVEEQHRRLGAYAGA